MESVASVSQSGITGVDVIQAVVAIISLVLAVVAFCQSRSANKKSEATAKEQIEIGKRTNRPFLACEIDFSSEEYRFSVRNNGAGIAIIETVLFHKGNDFSRTEVDDFLHNGNAPVICTMGSISKGTPIAAGRKVDFIVSSPGIGQSLICASRFDGVECEIVYKDVYDAMYSVSDTMFRLEDVTIPNGASV